MLKIEYLEEEIPVYDITVEGTHNFFANDILIHNCMEILLLTDPLESLDDINGQIALCILSAINVGPLKSNKELEEYCDIIVRKLDELIDIQDYPVKAAEISARKYRPLGVGITGLAHYFARNCVNYEDPEAVNLAHRLAESLQYYLLKASNQLAREKGPCEGFGDTKYSQGILPIDTYKKSIDEFCSEPLHHDWESLRQDIIKYGLRNTTLTAQMPCESCLFWKHKIKTSDGFMDFHQIAERSGLDWNEIELSNSIGWYDLKESIEVETLEGYKEVNKLYFNGNKEVITLTLDDGSEIKCTPNHRFLVKLEDGSTVWKRTYELKEEDDIVEF
jgi:ribonucleotide reductase alpha subunit